MYTKQQQMSGKTNLQQKQKIQHKWNGLNVLINFISDRGSRVNLKCKFKICTSADPHQPPRDISTRINYDIEQKSLKKTDWNAAQTNRDLMIEI